MVSASLPSDLKQKDWLKACKKLGLIVNCSYGKGSHCLVMHPQKGERFTIQKKMHKVRSQKMVKVLGAWGFSEEQIFAALK